MEEDPACSFVKAGAAYILSAQTGAGSMDHAPIMLLFHAGTGIKLKPKLSGEYNSNESQLEQF